MRVIYFLRQLDTSVNLDERRDIRVALRQCKNGSSNITSCSTMTTITMIEAPARATLTLFKPVTSSTSNQSTVPPQSSCSVTVNSCWSTTNQNRDSVDSSVLYRNRHNTGNGSLSDATDDLFSSTAMSPCIIRRPLPAPSTVIPSQKRDVNNRGKHLDGSQRDGYASETDSRHKPEIIIRSISLDPQSTAVGLYVNFNGRSKNADEILTCEQSEATKVEGKSDNGSVIGNTNFVTSSISEEEKCRRRESLQRMVS